MKNLEYRVQAENYYGMLLVDKSLGYDENIALQNYTNVVNKTCKRYLGDDYIKNLHIDKINEYRRRTFVKIKMYKEDNLLFESN
jgi:hypothetical protein